MNWDDLKFRISQMSAKDRKGEVRVFDPYFHRVTKVVGLDSLESVLDGKASSSESPVLILEENRK